MNAQAVRRGGRCPHVMCGASDVAAMVHSKGRARWRGVEFTTPTPQKMSKNVFPFGGGAFDFKWRA